MSMINWWKLNGNLIDSFNKLQMNTNGSLIYENAIHDQGIHLSSRHIYCNNPFIQKEEWGISFWVKDIGTADWCNIITFSDEKQRIEIYNNGSNWHWYSNGTTHSPLFPSVIIKEQLLRNVWHQIVLTYNHGKADLYLDNINVLHSSSASAFVDDGTNQIYFGSRGSGQYANIIISDIRFYNNCLSIYDINELYNNCIGFYSFENPFYEKTENLVTKLYNGGQTSIKNNGFITSGNNSDTYFRLGLKQNLIKDHIYTISCDAKINSGFFQFGLAGQSTNEPNMIIKNGHNEYTFICTEKISTKNPLLFDDIHREVFPCEFYNFQIEENNHSTPYIDNIRNYNIINDNSGWNHNLETNNIILSQDAPIGKYAFQFNNNYLKIKNSLFHNGDPIKLTISFWGYFENTGTNQAVFTNRAIAGHGISLFVLGSKFRFDCGQNNLWSVGFGPEFKHWDMYTFVADGTKRYYYKNGIEIAHQDPGNNGVHSDLGVFFSIGRAFTGESDAGYQMPAKNQIKDFKIYANALLESDIKELYEAHTIITDKQELISSDFIECDEDTNINPNGIINTKGLTEYDIDYKILEDHSIWFHIFHHNNQSKTILFKTEAEAKRIGISAYEDKYSRLDLLNTIDFKNVNGEYEFLLEYPSDTAQYNRWKQTSNPCTNTSVTGYQPIHIDWTSNYWGGILKDNRNRTFIKGSTDDSYWFYSIGCYQTYGNGIPSYSSTGKDTDLWVRIDNTKNNTLEEIQEVEIQKNGKLSSSEFIER